MAALIRLRTLFLRHFSKPPHNRPVYQAIARRRVKSILEIGVGTGERALRMIEAAAAHGPVREVRYTGVDLFEARSASDGPGMTLKMAHRVLSATGARIRLVPGDPLFALGQTANSLGPLDLVVISQNVEPASLARAWFYLPRTLHSQSLVLAEHPLPSGGSQIREIPPDEIHSLSGATGRRAA